MKTITVIKYNGRQSLEITGPEKMVSHMTVMPEFARQRSCALEIYRLLWRLKE